MDLMDKLHDASEQDSGISLSADDVRELLSMLAESAGSRRRGIRTGTALNGEELSNGHDAGLSERHHVH